MHYLLNLKLSNNDDSITTESNKFELRCIYLGSSIHNRVLSNGNFSRLYYSTEFCSFTGIYILLQFQDLYFLNDVSTNCNKMGIQLEKNKNILTKIRTIEHKILTTLPIKNKKPVFIIFNDLLRGYIKVNYKSTTNDLLLKISGIWETEYAYGLSYKYIFVRKHK